jgi:hypothetical protein
MVGIPGSAGVLAGNAFGILAAVALKTCKISRIRGYGFVDAGETPNAAYFLHLSCGAATR